MEKEILNKVLEEIRFIVREETKSIVREETKSIVRDAIREEIDHVNKKIEEIDKGLERLKSENDKRFGLIAEIVGLSDLYKKKVSMI